MYLALDYGDRYIGVAATDIEGRIPYRHSVIDQKHQDALPQIRQVVAQEEAVKVLVGVPVNLEGEETQQTHKTLEFIELLRESLGDDVEVEGVDETLTSVEAQRVLRHEGGSDKDEHAEAARLMLSDYLQTIQ